MEPCLTCLLAEYHLCTRPVEKASDINSRQYTLRDDTHRQLHAASPRQDRLCLYDGRNTVYFSYCKFSTPQLFIAVLMTAAIAIPLTEAQPLGDSPKESAELPGRNPSIKYNLWPRPPKPQAVQNPYPSSEKTMALLAGRSPTALSDTSVNLQKGTIWRRGGSLSNRRKISVPELGGTPKIVLGGGSSMDSRKFPLESEGATANSSTTSNHPRKTAAQKSRVCGVTS